MRTHEVKSWPEFFIPVEAGEKPFDLRRNDRDYQVNDLLRIREWVPKDGVLRATASAPAGQIVPVEPVTALGTYTGRECMRRITWILEGAGHVGVIEPLKGLNRGWVILGLAPPKKTCHRGTGDPPQECDWPQCGCDEAATRVLAALQEQGLAIVPLGALTKVMESMESGYAGDALEELRRAL